MDSPTAWKTGKFSEGYSIKISSPEPRDVLEPGLVSAIVKVVPKLHISRPRPGELVVWPLKTELEVAQVLQTISHTHPASTLQYDVQSTSLESVFLAVTQDEDTLAVVDSKEGMGQVVSAVPSGSSTKDLDVARHGTDFALSTEILTLSSGRAISLAAQALVIAIKRFMTLRRTYLMPLIGIVMVCCASLIPTGFIRSRNQTCARIYVTSTVSIACAQRRMSR
jgi:ATP-binding cassette, subfamily A (ABC1), member 3